MQLATESRPPGVLLVCLLIVVQAVTGVAATPGLLSWAPVLGGVVFVAVLAQSAATVGIWRLRTWGWALGVVAVPLGVLGPITSGFSLVLSAVLCLVVVGYLIARRSLFL